MIRLGFPVGCERVEGWGFWLRLMALALIANSAVRAIACSGERRKCPLAADPGLADPAHDWGSVCCGLEVGRKV